MFSNYIKITLRNLAKNKLFSLINIFGLSVGMASCLLLFLYASQELSYDTHHEKRIYRIISTLSQMEDNGQEFLAGTTSVPVGPALTAQIPEVMASARLTGASIFGFKDMITYEGNSHYVEGGVIADSTLFDVLEYDIIEGSPEIPLPHSNAIVLEKELAVKLFGQEPAIGKMLNISTAMGVGDYEVTGVYEKGTYDSHMEPSFIISMMNAPWKQFFDQMTNQWVTNNMVFTYLVLDDQADELIVDQKMDEIFLENGAEEMKELGFTKTMDLQEIEAIHNSTGFQFDAPDKTSLVFIQVLLLIGVLILILACVNYINLSTAQAGRRGLEVGVRKVMGVTSKGLIAQFLGESFVIVLISLVVSLGLAKALLPFFNTLINHPITLDSTNLVPILIFMGGFLVVISLLAGFYPAFYLSSFKPTSVLKGRSKDSSGTSIVRKALVVVQFVISIVLISAILIISKQVDYIKNKELGFESASKIIVPLTTNAAKEQYSVLKQKFERHSAVRQTAGADAIPGSQILNDILVYKSGQSMEQAQHIYNNRASADFVQTLDIDLIQGEVFPEGTQFPPQFSDSVNSYIYMNKSAAETIGFEEGEAVGSVVYFDIQGVTIGFEIKGIFEDINQFSLHSADNPLVITLANGGFQYMIVDADLTNFQELIGSMEEDWKSVVEAAPFEYFTLDDHLNMQYAGDFNTFNLIKYFAFISIIISSLGLYALSMFVAERRFKEIGVRKALGASEGNIIFMVSKDLSILIIISFVLSVPITIYGINMWLDTFAYRVTPGVGIYVVAGLISILIGWLTISYQSIRAARTNPVNVLHDE